MNSFEVVSMSLCGRQIRPSYFLSIILAACFAALPTWSFAQSFPGQEFIEAQDAERERLLAVARAALAAEQEKQRREAEVAKERMRRDQDATTRALTVALLKEAQTEAERRNIERLTKETKKAYAQASAERDRADKRSRELERTALELKIFDAKLQSANKELGRANAKLNSANEKLEQAQKEYNLRALSLEIWRAVLSVSLLGLLASNVFTYMNMRRDRMRGTLQNELTSLQIEEMRIKVEQLKSSTSRPLDTSNDAQEPANTSLNRTAPLRGASG